MPEGNDELQFETAESKDERKRCTFCNSVITDAYYHVQGLDSCPKCAEARQTLQNLPDNPRQFLRAIFYGCCAAFAGLVIWTLVQYYTGYQIGLLAIGIGWGIGTAIKNATHGHTSRKYQILAVGLTYAAIAMSTLPLAIAEIAKKGDPAKQEQGKGTQEKKDEAPVMAAADERPSIGGFFLTIGVLLGLSFLSPILTPFYDFPGGLITVLITFWALQQAWSLTKPDDAAILGPYKVEEAA